MIIKCKECGKEISDKAEKCVSCGFPIKIKPKACLVSLRVFLGIITILLATLYNSYVINKMQEESLELIEAGGLFYVLLWISGILGLCLCKNTNYKILIIPTVLIFIGYLSCSYYSIYGILGMAIGLFWLLIAHKQKKSIE